MFRDIQNLISKGILEKEGDGRSTHYAIRDIGVCT
jgi:hypothetical protein